MILNLIIFFSCVFGVYWLFFRKPKNMVTLDMANAAPYKVEAPAPGSIDLTQDQLTKASLNNGDSDAPEWLIEQAAADDVVPKAAKTRKPRTPKAAGTVTKPRAKKAPKVT